MASVIFTHQQLKVHGEHGDFGEMVTIGVEGGSYVSFLFRTADEAQALWQVLNQARSAVATAYVALKEEET